MEAGPDQVVIGPASGARDVADCKRMFVQYFTWLEQTFDLSLEFQNVEAELATLPGAYVPPGGGLFVARTQGGRAAGCIAFRRLSADTCELKRLYVDPEVRGGGLGRRLTLRALTAARRIYAELGFVEIAPYYDNPLQGVCYMGRVLDPDQGSGWREH